MANTWLDDDGLYHKYGTTKATAHIGGEYTRVGGDYTEVEFTLNLTTVGSSAGIIDDVVVIPAGARIQEVEVLCHTAADSTNDDGTLNLGLIKTDRTTEIDYDGLLASYDQSRMDAAGEKNTVVVGGTDAGALLGTTLTYTGHVTADYDTHAFTAGVVRIRIRYYMP